MIKIKEVCESYPYPCNSRPGFETYDEDLWFQANQLHLGYNRTERNDKDRKDDTQKFTFAQDLSNKCTFATNRFY
jgi:hypothetical protein